MKIAKRRPPSPAPPHEVIDQAKQTEAGRPKGRRMSEVLAQVWLREAQGERTPVLDRASLLAELNAVIDANSHITLRGLALEIKDDEIEAFVAAERERQLTKRR